MKNSSAAAAKAALFVFCCLGDVDAAFPRKLPPKRKDRQ